MKIARLVLLVGLVAVSIVSTLALNDDAQIVTSKLPANETVESTWSGWNIVSSAVHHADADRRSLQIVRNLEAGARRLVSGSLERLVLLRRVDSETANGDDPRARAETYARAAFDANDEQPFDSPNHMETFDEVLVLSLPLIIWLLILTLICCCSCIVCRLLSCCIC